MDLEILRKQYKALIADARAIADQWTGKEADMPATVAGEIAGKLGKADEVKATIVAAERIAVGEAFLAEPADTKAAHLGWRPAAPGEGDVTVDAKAWREEEISTPYGERKTIRFHIPLATQAKGYDSAFEGYLRKGREGMSSQDRKTLSEGVDSAGGFLVPPDMMTSILKKVATLALIRNRARVITTSRDLVKWPKVVYNADNKYTSGVRMTWTGETPNPSTVHRVTDPVFGEEQIPVNTAMASMPITNSLLEDAAFDVLGLVSQLIGEAFALGEDDVFINGSGAGQPQGILNHPSASVIHTTPGGMYVKSGSAAALTADGLIDLESALPAQYERNAVWLMNKATKASLRKLKDLANFYLFPGYLQGGPLSSGPSPDFLMGYPLLKDEFMPDIAANSFPIVFGDLSGYLVVDRTGLSVQVLRELYAETDIALVLARKRLGGQLIEPYRLRTHKMEA